MFDRPTDGEKDGRGGLPFDQGGLRETHERRRRLQRIQRDIEEGKELSQEDLDFMQNKKPAPEETPEAPQEAPQDAPGGGEGEERVDAPDIDNPEKTVNTKEGENKPIVLDTITGRPNTERSALFPRMQLDTGEGADNFNERDPAGVRGIRKFPEGGESNEEFKQRGVSFDNPMQVNDGVLGRVDIPESQKVPDIGEAPVLADDANEEDRKKHADDMKAYNVKLAQRNEIIQQNNEALKMRNEAGANFANSGRVRGSLAGSGTHKVATQGPDGQPRERGMSKGEQATHNTTLRDQARQANNNRIAMNKFNDFKKNSNMQRGVSNWVDQAIANGELDVETLGGKNFNEIMKNNPDQAMRLVQDFKDRSAQDSITRRDAMRPETYTEAQVQKAMADAGFQNVNGQMVNHQQADMIQRRMGLPGSRMFQGLGEDGNPQSLADHPTIQDFQDKHNIKTFSNHGRGAFQQRNPHGVLTDSDGSQHPDNRFGPVETPMLTQGVNDGKILRGNPAGVQKVGPDGIPYMEPSTEPIFRPAPGTEHRFPTFRANQDTRNFSPTQLTNSNNWNVPTGDFAADNTVRAPQSPTQTSQPTSIPQGGIPGIGQPQDNPSPKPNMDNPLPATAPQNMFSPEGDEEEKRKKQAGFMQGIFG